MLSSCDINSLRPSARRKYASVNWPSWVQITACCLVETEPSSAQCMNIVNLNLRNNFCDILSEIHTTPFKYTHMKMSSAKWRQFYLGLNMLTIQIGDLSSFNTKTVLYNAGFHFSRKPFHVILEGKVRMNSIITNSHECVFCAITFCDIKINFKNAQMI